VALSPPERNTLELNKYNPQFVDMFFLIEALLIYLVKCIISSVSASFLQKPNPGYISSLLGFQSELKGDVITVHIASV